MIIESDLESHLLAVSIESTDPKDISDKSVTVSQTLDIFVDPQTGKKNISAGIEKVQQQVLEYILCSSKSERPKVLYFKVRFIEGSVIKSFIHSIKNTRDCNRKKNSY